MKHTKISSKRILAALLCLCMLLPLTACGESKMTQRQVSAMNTIMTLTAYGKKAEIGLNAAEGVILAPPDFARQLEALCLATREGWRSLSEREVAQPQIVQDLQLGCCLTQRPQFAERLVNGHCHQLWQAHVVALLARTRA